MVDPIADAFRRLEEWRKKCPSRGYQINSPEWEDPVWIVIPTVGVSAANATPVRHRNLDDAVQLALKQWGRGNP